MKLSNELSGNYHPINWKKQGAFFEIKIQILPCSFLKNSYIRLSKFNPKKINMLNEYFTTSFSRLSSSNGFFFLSALVTGSLAVVLNTVLAVIANSRSFPMFLFAAFVVLAAAFAAQLVSFFDYFNTKYQWFPGFKVRS